MWKLILKQYKNLKIANKLNFLGVSIALTATIMSVASLFMYQNYTQKELLKSQAETFGKVLADNITPAILFQDNNEITAILSSLKHQEDFIQVYVMDNKLKILEVYDKQKKELLNKKILNDLKTEESLWEDSNIFSIIPISVHGEENLGSLIIVSSLSKYYERLFEELLIILIIALFSIWFTLKITFPFKNEILFPLDELNKNIAKIVETQDLTNHAPVFNDDEIGKLGVNFNTMLYSLNQMRKELIEEKDGAEYKAHHDVLTALPNRMRFSYRLDQVLSSAKRNKEYFAVFFIDLDHFKQINDSMGHDVGDEVLKIFAKRIQKCIRLEDTIARMGGDEFTVILEHLNTIQSPTIVANKIIIAMQEPLMIRGQELFLSASIGITVYPEDGNDTQTLIKNADAAMYHAKNNGRNQYQFFTTKMTEIAYERVVFQAQLRHALKKEEFVVYYQPQINALTNEIIGMEALVRWRHPERGLLSPAKFLPQLAETDLIVEMDRWVMGSGIKQLQEWHEQNLNPGYLSLNLSMRHLMKKDFIENLKKLLKKSNCDEKFIHLEITEGQVMQDPEYSIKLLNELNDMGISLEIDDFGTGYSSLSYLKRLPINTVKIDRSFIKDLPWDEEDIAITKAIIALSNSLNLNIIAEGVENIEQKDFLVEHGCTNIQGYFYGKPMKAEEMEKFLKQKKASFIVGGKALIFSI